MYNPPHFRDVAIRSDAQDIRLENLHQARRGGVQGVPLGQTWSNFGALTNISTSKLEVLNFTDILDV